MDLSQMSNVMSLLNGLSGSGIEGMLGGGAKDNSCGCGEGHKKSSSLFLFILILLLCCRGKRGIGGSGCYGNSCGLGNICGIGNSYGCGKYHCNTRCLDDCCCLRSKKDRKRCKKLKKKIEKRKHECCGCPPSYGYGGQLGCFGGSGCSWIIILIIIGLLCSKCHKGGRGGDLSSLLNSLGAQNDDEFEKSTNCDDEFSIDA